MHLRRLGLHDFRCHADVELSFPEGLTVVQGPNAAGKSSILEAIGYLATLRSFRGAPLEALVRVGTSRAVARGELRTGERSVLLEAEIAPGGRNRFLINKQPLRRTRELADVVAVSAFSPDDLILVKGGPSERRDYVDQLVVQLRARDAELIDDVERVLRQRNALLKQAGGRLADEVALTLDVWDAKLASLGSALGDARVQALERLSPWLGAAYRDIAGTDRDGSRVGWRYVSGWRDRGLAAALAAGRGDDVRRGLTLTGPHRDDVELTIDGRPSRTHASQGEQRTLALALRLAAHRVVGDALGSAPVLLLDDVFSELDPDRSAALLRHLPPGQAILATAGSVPPEANVSIRLVLPFVANHGSENSGSVDNPVESVDDTALEGLS